MICGSRFFPKPFANKLENYVCASMFLHVVQSIDVQCHFPRLASIYNQSSYSEIDIIKYWYVHFFFEAYISGCWGHIATRAKMQD